MMHASRRLIGHEDRMAIYDAPSCMKSACQGVFQGRLSVVQHFSAACSNSHHALGRTEVLHYGTAGLEVALRRRS